MPVAATTVSDDALAMIRGKYVPPGQSHVTAVALTAPSSQLGSPAQSFAASTNTASPLANVASAGTVYYFGIEMQTSWNVTNGTQTVGDTVGMSIGINAGSHSATVKTWSTALNGGVPGPTTATDGVQGAPALANFSSGVGQSVQVAGNGNIAQNQASVSYGNAGLTLTPVALVNTCGTQCTTTSSGDVFGVAITTPRGTVSQSIGSGLVNQSVQAWSDANQITNQLGIQIQGQPSASGLSPGKLATILTALQGLP